MLNDQIFILDGQIVRLKTVIYRRDKHFNSLTAGDDYIRFYFIFY